MKLAEELKNKKILIWGYGREGQSTLSFLRTHCPETLADIADGREIAREEGMNEIFHCPQGSKPKLEGYDFIFKSPGIPLIGLAPEEIARLTSQTQLFMEIYRRQIIGVTGTKGKSTTASLLAHILQSAGREALLVGNIGLPCFDFADRITEGTVIVFELSCHQLEMLTVSPHTALFLNLYPDHLDHYGTFERYAAAKWNILNFQKKGDHAILGQQAFAAMSAKARERLWAYWRRNEIEPVWAHNENDSHESGATCKETAAPVGRLGAETVENGGGILVRGNQLRVYGEAFAIGSGETKLRGLHNVYNIAVVYYICKYICGMEREAFMRGLSDFSGLPHRLQFIGNYRGIDYYDDSISTVCETAIQAVSSVENAATLILGGMDRGIDYRELVEFLLHSRIRNVLLLPDTGARIALLFHELGGSMEPPRLVHCKNMQEAVDAAMRLTPVGGACILSPAAASYGFYKNFEERGEIFAALVHNI